MDLLTNESGLSLDNKNWKIYARNSAEPPQYIAAGSYIKNAIISEGAVIKGTVVHSIISHSAVVEEGAEVRDSVILPGAYIGKNAKVNFSIVAEKAVIGDGACVGERLEAPVKGEWEIAVVGPAAEVKNGETVEKGQMLGAKGGKA